MSYSPAMSEAQLLEEQASLERWRRRRPGSADLADDLLRLIRFQLGQRRIVLAGCGPGGELRVLRDPDNFAVDATTA